MKAILCVTVGLRPEWIKMDSEVKEHFDHPLGPAADTVLIVNTKHLVWFEPGVYLCKITIETIDPAQSGDPYAGEPYEAFRATIINAIELPII